MSIAAKWRDTEITIGFQKETASIWSPNTTLMFIVRKTVSIHDNDNLLPYLLGIVLNHPNNSRKLGSMILDRYATLDSAKEAGSTYFSNMIKTKS